MFSAAAAAAAAAAADAADAFFLSPPCNPAAARRRRGGGGGRLRARRAESDGVNDQQSNAAVALVLKATAAADHYDTPVTELFIQQHFGILNLLKRLKQGDTTKSTEVHCGMLVTTS